MVEVKVKASGKGSSLVDYEVSGGETGTMGSDTQTFRVGKIQSMICFLTLKRLADCSIHIETDGDLALEVDGKKKSLKKGRSLDVSPKAKRILVKEKVK